MGPRMGKNDWNQNQIHEKGWGHELWIENLPEYCGKLLHFQAGKKTSLHYHVVKLETMHLASGRIDIDMIDPLTAEKYTVNLFPGDSLRICPGHAHQIIALKESDLYEFSTTHDENDSFRVVKGD